MSHSEAKEKLSKITADETAKLAEQRGLAGTERQKAIEKLF